MKEWLSTGEMIDVLLDSPTLQFMDSENEWTSLIDRGCVVFKKFEGHRTTTIMLEDKNKKWKVKE